MTEQQVKNAMTVLAKLYAEQKGFTNPQIIIGNKKIDTARNWEPGDVRK